MLKYKTLGPYKHQKSCLNLIRGGQTSLIHFFRAYLRSEARATSQYVHNGAGIIIIQHGCYTIYNTTENSP